MNERPAVLRPACACAVCFALPPYLSEHLRRHSRDPQVQEVLASMHRASVLLRQQRSAMLATPVRSAAAPIQPVLNRRIYDCRKTTDLLNRLVRKEGSKPSADKTVNEAYDHSGTTFSFFAKVFGRSSVDNANLPLTSSVHYQEDPRFGYDNAFWDGRQMVYGDGFLFNPMTQSLDIVAHELSHGVTQYEAALRYENQSGALNEHFSDVFGVLARQWANNERRPAKADWSVGRGLFRKKSMAGMSLRSMSAPGTAHDDPEFGRDPQPALMKHFVKLPNTADGDWGGVHYNSGIPNKAFHLAAVAIGGPAWDVPGHIWYVALTQRLRDNASFRKCAYETISVAGNYHGPKVGQAVRDAWVAVGVIKAGEGPKG